MTATLDPEVRLRVLTDRLTSLQNEREEARAETAPTASGDDADRATNVEVHLRMAMLDQQIATIELELMAGVRHKDPKAADTAEVGDIVTVDFGDGPEEFLLAPVEQSGEGVDVITPDSPLGKALVGARTGTTVQYQASRRPLEARLVSVAA